MQTEIQNPVNIQEWNEKLLPFHQANIFHTSMWARVLSNTYGYDSQYIIGKKKGQVVSLMPLMHIMSPITGKRGVSLPFTDVCPILISEESHKKILWNQALEQAKANQWNYIETRSNQLLDPETPVSTQFYEHKVMLNAEPEQLFQRMKSSTRRNIRKAEQSKVTIQHEQSLDAMKLFYQLHSLTRKRHGMPIQPWEFFKNIYKYILQTDHGFISIAYYQDKPIASSVYFYFGQNALYKFGASNLDYQSVRPNDLIQWNAIKHFQSTGFKSLSLGRTDWGHEGLRRYKLGLGTEESIIKYHKYDIKKKQFNQVDLENENAGFHMKNAPIIVLKMIGQFAYKHVA